MANILRLFLADLASLKVNVIAAIVAMGLLLVPSLYAWFSLLAFWNPDAQTSELPVAVANNDVGFSSALVPSKIEAGNEVISALHENDSFKWVFTTEQDAIEGVRSGAYFAALVIPEDFSRNLLTIFNGRTQPATIAYYVNQKENAVAPELTQEGANQLQHGVDKEFAQVVSNVALSTTSSLMSFMNGEGIKSYGQDLVDTLTTIVDELNGATQGTSAFATLTGSCSTLLSATSEVLTQTSAVSNTVMPLLTDVQDGLAQGSEALGSVSGLVDDTLTQSEGALGELSTSANAAIDGLSNAVPGAQEALNNAAGQAGALAGAYDEVRQALSAANTNGLLDPAIGLLQSAAQNLWTLQGDLSQASADLGQGIGDATASRDAIASHISAATSALNDLHTNISGDLAQNATALGNTLTALRDQTANLGQVTSSEAQTLSETATTLSEDLQQVKSALDTTSASLAQTAQSLSASKDELSQALDSGDLERVRTIIGTSSTTIATFLSSPTELVRHDIYPMDNNGSAMSAFYLSLAIWIGCIFEIALIKTSVSPTRQAAIEAKTAKPLTLTQCYLGRFGVFCVMALCQATILTLGALWFLGIQCLHPWLLLVSAWLCAIVFSNIIYTLVLSFGRVGEALVVVGLVAQIAGAGGIFPVELSGPFFEALYPWLPFAHSITAFSSCIAGIYDGQLWQSLALLVAFMGPSLVLGLVLRRPVVRLNEFIDAQVERTHLIFKE